VCAHIHLAAGKRQKAATMQISVGALMPVRFLFDQVVTLTAESEMSDDHNVVWKCRGYFR
jgi:hypothetical protein